MGGRYRYDMYIHLTSSFQENLGKLGPECQTILCFTAAKDVGNGNDDRLTVKHPNHLQT